jgi:hypothetical protein
LQTLPPLLNDLTSGSAPRLPMKAQALSDAMCLVP